MCRLGFWIEGYFQSLLDWRIPPKPLVKQSCRTWGFTWVGASFKPLEMVSWHYAHSLRQRSHIWKHIFALINIFNVKIAQMRTIWHIIPWFKVKDLEWRGVPCIIWKHVACHWLFHGEKVNIKGSAPHRRKRNHVWKRNHVYCHLDEGILDLGVVITTISLLLAHSSKTFHCAINIWSHLAPFKESTCAIEGQVAQIDLIKSHCNLQE